MQFHCLESFTARWKYLIYILVGHHGAAFSMHAKFVVKEPKEGASFEEASLEFAPHYVVLQTKGFPSVLIYSTNLRCNLRGSFGTTCLCYALELLG
jgi:hypothetical protein